MPGSPVRKVKYTREATRLFWNLDAPRTIRLRALTIMRDLAGAAYPGFKRDRVKGKSELCRYQYKVREGSIVYLFIDLFDDTVDPASLILKDWHSVTYDLDDL